MQILTGAQTLESDTARIHQTLTSFQTDVAEARHGFVSTVQQQLGDTSGDEAPWYEVSFKVPSPVHRSHSDDYINIFASD